MITPELWTSKPVTTEHVRFTGFSAGGNGFELLAWLEGRGVHAVGDGDELHLDTREREDATARSGDWIIFGTQGEVYPVSPEVHADKYDPAES